MSLDGQTKKSIQSPKRRNVKTVLVILAVIVIAAVYVGIMFMGYDLRREEGKGVLKSLIMAPLIIPLLLWEYLLEGGDG